MPKNASKDARTTKTWPPLVRTLVATFAVLGLVASGAAILLSFSVPTPDSAPPGAAAVAGRVTYVSPAPSAPVPSMASTLGPFAVGVSFTAGGRPMVTEFVRLYPPAPGASVQVFLDLENPSVVVDASGRAEILVTRLVSVGVLVVSLWAVLLCIRRRPSPVQSDPQAKEPAPSPDPQPM